MIDSMGVSFQEKAELIVYQLKDMAQVWYEQWKYERLVIEGRINLRAFKKTFIDTFFPLKLSKRKMQ